MDANKENQHVTRGRKRSRDLVRSPQKKSAAPKIAAIVEAPPQPQDLGEICRRKTLLARVETGCGRNPPRSVYLSEMQDLLVILADSAWEKWDISTFQPLVDFYAMATTFKVNGEHHLKAKHDAVQRELRRMMSTEPELVQLIDPTYLVIDTVGAISQAHSEVLANWPPRPAVAHGPPNATKYPSTVTAVDGSTRLYHIQAPTVAQAQMDAHALVAVLHVVDNSAKLSLWDTAFAPTSYP